MSAVDKPSHRPDLVSRWRSMLEAFASSLAGPVVLDVLLEQGQRMLAAQGAVIAVLDGEGDHLTIIRAIGLAGTGANARVSAAAAPPLSEVARSGEPLWIYATVEADPETARVFPPEGHRSLLVVPFRAGGRAGALGFSMAREHAFSLDDLEFALALAAQCAQAVSEDAPGNPKPAGALPWSMGAGFQSEARAAIEAANGFRWEWDLDTGRIVHSPEVEHVTGYSPEEFARAWRSWANLIHPEHPRPSSEQEAVAFIRSLPQEGFSNEYRIRRKDGHDVWVLERALIVRDEAGQPKRVIGHTVNIHERKTTELALRSGEARYRGLVELSPDAILIHQDGVYTFANAAAVRLFGADGPEQIIGKSPFDLLHPAWHSTVRERLERLANGERVSPLQEKIVRLDGATVDVEVSATPYATENGNAVLLIMRDVSERTAHEAALLDSERRYRSMFENAAVGILLFDLDGGFISVNDRLAEMLGHTRQALLALDWQMLSHPEETPLHQELRDRLARGDVDDVTLERRMVHANGSIVWAALTARAVQDEQGSVLYAIAFLQDITARKQAEESLRSSEARYRNLMDSIDQGFCVFEMLYDADGKAADYRFLEVNPPFEQHTGLKNALGRTARSMVPDLEIEWIERYAHVAETGEMMRFEMGSLAMGRLFEVEAARVGAPHERKVALLFRDITGRRHAEHAIRESEEKYRSLFTSIEAGYVLIELVYDDAGTPVDARYLEANVAAERMLGAAMVGRTVRELYPDLEDTWFEIYDRVARTGVSERREQYAEALGTWFDFFAFKIGAPDSRRVAITYQDMTSRKRREANVAFLADIAGALSQHTTVDGIMRVLGEKIGRHLDVAFCEFAALDQANDRIDFLGRWNATGAPQLPERVRLSDQATVEFFEAARAGEPLVATDTQTDPLAHTGGNPLDSVRSFIAIPMHRDGELRYLFAVHDSRPRDWRDDEIELVRDIGQRVFARLERVMADEQLRHAAELDAYRVRLSDALRPLDHPGELMETSARILGEQLRVDRVRYWEVGDDREHLVVPHVEYANDQAIDLPTRFRLQDVSPLVRGEFEADRPVAIADTLAQPGVLPTDGETYRQVRAFIAYPLIREGRLHAILSVIQMDPRAWTADEIAIVRETAERTWTAVERARAEDALRASDQHLGALVNQTISAIIETDLNGMYLFVNDRYCELTGYAREDLIGKMRMHDITHPDDVAQTDRSLRRLVAEGVPFAIQKRYVRPDGSIVWIDKSVSAITDRDGRRQSIVAVMVDITEHKRAEVDLRRREARSRFLAGLHEQLDRATEPQGVLDTATSALKAFLGVGNVGFVDVDQRADVDELLPAQSLAAPEAGDNPLRAHLRAGRTAVIADANVDPLTRKRARALEGRAFRAGVAVPVMREGRWAGALAVTQDAPRAWDADDVDLIRTVTERVWLAYENARLLRDLSEREERLQIVGAATQDAIFDWDMRAERVWHNHSFVAQFGNPVTHEARADLAFWSTRLHPADRDQATQTLLRAIQEGASGCTLEYRIRRTNGDYAYVLERTLIARDAHGQAVRVVGALTDLTERHQWEVALRESEERFRSMAQTTNRGIWLLDGDGRTQFANAYLADLLGYAPIELVGRPLTDFCFPEDVDTARAHIAANLRGESQEFDFRLRRRDGSPIAVLAGTSPVRDARGIVGALGAFTDITARQRVADQTRFLAESTRALTESLEVSRTLQEVARLAVPVMADWCTLNLLDPDGSIRLAAAAHREPDVEPRLWQLAREHPLKPDGAHGTPAVIRSGELELSQFTALADAPETAAELYTGGPGTLLIVPLLTAHRTYGALSLARLDTGRGFDPDDVALALEVARRAALAIENAAYFHDEQVARARAEADRERITRLQTVTAMLSQTLTQEQVFEVAVRASMAALGASAGAIYVLSGDGGWIERAHARGYSGNAIEDSARLARSARTPIGEVVATGRALWVESPVADDARPGPARAIVPLILADRVIGAIELSFAGPVPFSVEDRDLLLALAAQCAQALERARLLEAERQARAAADAAARASTFLADASKLLARSLDDEATYQDAVLAAVRGLADFAIIWEATDDGIQVRAWAGAEPGAAPLLAALEQAYRPQPGDPGNLAAQVLGDGQPVLERLVEPRQVDDTDVFVNSHILVPLLGRRGTHGVLALVRSEPGRRYTGDDLALAEEFARRAALAGENARLYLEAQAWNATLEERVAERTEALRRSQEDLRQLAAYQHRVRELERRHIAQEIHDEMGGTLTGMKMMVAGIRRRRASTLNDEELQELSSLIDDTVQTVRRIASELRPAILDSLGLLPALEWQAREFQKRTGIICNVTVPADEFVVDEETSIAVFRVFQESLTNVARHAEATEVVATVERDGDWAHIRVADNGHGLPPGAIQAGKSLGLLGMRERIEHIAGEFDIVGTPGAGTTVVIRIPLARPQAPDA